MRVLEKINDFLDFFLGLVATSHIGKSHRVGRFVEHTGFRFAEAESPALAATLHLPHEVNPHANQQQHRAPADQQRHEQRALFARFDVKLDVVGDQVTDQATIKIGRGRADFPVVVGGGDDFCAALSLGDGRGLDAFAAHLFQKLGISKVVATSAAACIKLLENGKQHHGDNKPDCNFGKPLIVQG